MKLLLLLVAQIIILLSLFPCANKHQIHAQTSSRFYTSSTQWSCPTSCIDNSAALNQFCSSNFGGGGSLSAIQCVTDPNTGNLLSFKCSCNSDNAQAIEIVRVDSLTTTATTTTEVPTTTFESTTTTMISTDDNATTDVNASTTTSDATTSTTTTSTTTQEPSSTTDPSATTSTSNTTSTAANTTTTTTSTSTTTVTSPPQTGPVQPLRCQVKPGTAPYFQRSPLGMFCRVVTGACPWSCDENVVAQFAEECDGAQAKMQCERGTNVIRASCTTCNSRVFTVTTDLLFDGRVAGCSHSVSYTDSSPANNSFEITNPGSCGTDRCSLNGCCRNDRCSCFDSDSAGHYDGATCSSCNFKYNLDQQQPRPRCTVLVPPVLQLFNLLGRRPSAIVAPVLCLMAVLMFLFALRGRWQTDQERYVIPAGVALTDPVSGFSVNPRVRFFIPPRPIASRGIANQRASERRATMLLEKQN